MKHLLFFAFLILSFPLSAQRSHLEAGDEYFRKRYYVEAITEYKLALNEKVVIKKYYMTERVAKTYKMLFDYENAVEWYAKLMEFKEENTAENILNYAQLLMNLEQYAKAKDVFAIYAEKSGRTLAKDLYGNWCKWALDHKDSTRKFSVYLTDIETGSRSMGIAFYQNGLVFSKPQIQEFDKKTSFYDLAYLKFKDTIHFELPEILKGELNRSFYEGTPNFSRDEKTLYYTGNSTTTTKYRPKKADKVAISKEGVNILKLYSASVTNGEWGNVKELPVNSNQYDCVFPFITDNGKRIYFVSNMPGGVGGYDVYYTDLNTDGTWTLPKNPGEKINSPFDEMYPFVKGDSLFFSSKGREGFGGADIYISRVSGDGFTKAENLGKPFNSPKDDFSFIVREEKGLLHGYFSSNREGTHGYDKIYYFKQHPKPVYPDTIRGIALNKITLIPLKDVKITLTKIASGKPGEKINEQTTDKTGAVELILDKKVEYTVAFEAKGFQTKTVEIPADKREDVLALFGDLKLDPVIEKNSIIKIPNIYFDYDKATIRPESIKVLTQIIGFLNDNPTIRVELSAHTDARGSDPYNMKLSQKRAESTVKYLVEHGIDAKRLVPKGYGETKIQNQCKNGVKCSEEEHEFNRRVEMKVL